MTRSNDARERPIADSERSGVLYPGRLERYRAGWIDPDPAVSAIVDQYWHVSWELGDGERLEQPIIDLPAVTVSIEEGDVPAPFVITGVQKRAWQRTIHGTGRVFAIRLRPAGLAVLSDLAPQQVADATVPLTVRLDARPHGLMRAIASRSDPAERARAADEAVRHALVERTPTTAGGIANAVLGELRERQHRLQEVALALVTRPSDELAAIAADLGYTDQSHLTRDFRASTGLTPDAYRRAAARLAP
jgi:AraC-like DNA-binding protein